MPRRLFALALGAAAAALVASRRRPGPAAAGRDGARERTERLRRELEGAREQLREDLARTREQS